MEAAAVTGASTTRWPTGGTPRRQEVLEVDLVLKLDCAVFFSFHFTRSFCHLNNPRPMLQFTAVTYGRRKLSCRGRYVEACVPAYFVTAVSYALKMLLTLAPGFNVRKPFPLSLMVSD